MAPNPDQRCVLTFHGIGEPGRAIDPGEAGYWIEWKTFDDILSYRVANDRGGFGFTFDDGYASDLVAARKMRAAGVDGSFFVLVGRIGETGSLNRDDLHEMIDMGMEIGLHGRDHVNWRDTDDATLHSEIDLARAELADILGRPVTSVAIPFGAYNRRVWNYLERSDFARIYTSDRGLSHPHERFVRRHTIAAHHTIADLPAMRSGEASLVGRLRRTVMPLLKRVA